MKRSTFMNIDRFNNNFIDLHLHLDGSISSESARVLAKIQNIDIPSDPTALLSLPKNATNLNDYLKCFDFPLSLLQNEDAITQSIINLTNELKQIGLTYAEIRFAPQLHNRLGLTQKQVVIAARKGIKESELDSNLILCTMRGENNEKENKETIKLCAEFLGDGIVAADLAGAEGIYPTKNFKSLFQYACSLGIPFTIHAGEADDANSVICALDMGARRIGHGVRSATDDNLLKRIKKDNIPLELCPTSNLQTGAVNDLKNYPINKFIDHDIIVTINSDNMSVSSTNVKKELEIISDVFGLDEIDIQKLLINSANAAFVSDDKKEKMINKIKNA